MLGRVDEGDARFGAAHQAAEAARAEDVLVDIETLQGLRLMRRRTTTRRSLSCARPWYTRAPCIRRTPKPAFRSTWASVACCGCATMKRSHTSKRRLLSADRESRTLYSLARSNLAICYSQLGEHDRALEYSLAERGPKRTLRRQSLPADCARRDWSYLHDEGRSKALPLPYLERALSLASEANITRDAAIWAGNLSECYSELRDWQNAASFNQEAIRLKTAANLHTLYYNVLNAARIARGRGDSVEAARLYQQAIDEGKNDPAVVWEAHAGLGAVALQQHQPAAAVQHFEAAVNVLEKTRADVVSTELKLPFLTQRISLYQQYVETLIDQGESDRALAVADSSRAQVLAGHSGSVPPGVCRPRPSAPSLARTARSCFPTGWALHGLTRGW